MNTREQEFQKRLLSTFKLEAAEHIQALSSGLIELESAPDADKRSKIVETVFRRAHSLKGAARAVGLTEVESICQAAESVFSALKQGQIDFSQALSDVLHEAVDALGRFLLQIESADSDKHKPPITDLVRRLDSAARGAVLPSPKSDAQAHPPMHVQPRSDSRPLLPEEKPALAGTVRIATGRLDALLFQTEELLSARLAASQRAAELREVLGELAMLKKERESVAPATSALQHASEKTAEPKAGDKTATHWRELLQFTLRADRLGKSLEARLQALAKSAEHDQRSLGAMVDGLREDMKKALMLPFSSLLDMLPKLVRDLARDQRKDVELSVSGAGIEIDRRILQEMRDSLIHLVRNSIDHGIETPEARKRAGKPARGRLSLAITQTSGSKIEIRIADDGAGIDIEKVREAARKAGVGSEDLDSRDERDALALVFESGVSTSPLITGISGRGLGLAIVSEKAEKLGGSVSVETHPGRGTEFRIVLPLTLATFRGVHVRVSDRRFVLPTAQVVRALRVKTETIKTVKNRETIAWNGQAVALVRLADVLELPRARDEAGTGESLHVILLGAGGKPVAFGVDEIVGEQEVLVKGLGKLLVRVRNVTGAAVLGSGEVVPILNVLDLLRSSVKVVAPAARGTQQRQAARSILVAEDSITSRALLKNILESAGYDVAAVVDGREAFTRLKTQRYDLVVSDVEMPRMDGFELTAKIRSDEAIAALPVVLVTGLDSREHRERGAEVGANAYIVKSSFDHGDLLQTIERLI